MLNVEFDDFIKKGYKLKDKDGFLYCLYESISNSLYSCLERMIMGNFFIIVLLSRIISQLS